jgi:hypothetical protein
VCKIKSTRATAGRQVCGGVRSAARRACLALNAGIEGALSSGWGGSSCFWASWNSDGQLAMPVTTPVMEQQIDERGTYFVLPRSPPRAWPRKHHGLCAAGVLLSAEQQPSRSAGTPSCCLLLATGHRACSAGRAQVSRRG